jgi:hypothetical protein
MTNTTHTHTHTHTYAHTNVGIIEQTIMKIFETMEICKVSAKKCKEERRD